MLSAMWMLAKFTSVHGLKRNQRSPACLCPFSRGCSAKGWEVVSSPSGVEGLAFYKDLSIKVRPASLPLLTVMTFSRVHRFLRCQMECCFWENNESIHLVLNLFATQMISNTLLSWKLREDLIEPSEIRSLKIMLRINHPIRGSSVMDIAMIEFISFSCSFS